MAVGNVLAGLRPAPRWSEFFRMLVVCLIPFAVSCVAVDPPKPKALVQGNDWAPAVEYRPGKPPERKGDGAKSEDVLLIAALSGGGKRSAAFSFGVFSSLENAKVNLLYEADDSSEKREQRTKAILRELDILSAVSGGAFTASYYALHRDDIFKPRQEECSFEHFLFEDVGAEIYGMYLLPWKWGWAFDSSYGTNDLMASFYAKRLFSGADDCSANFRTDSTGKTIGPHGATYENLYDAYSKGSPFLILESTDITRGIAFPYHQDSFDLLCSDISTFPLAWALAGSNAFPVVLSTVGLENHHAEYQGLLSPEEICRPKGNNWLKNVIRLTLGKLNESEKRRNGCVPVEEFIDEAVENIGLERRFFRSNLLPHVASCYLWPGEAAYTHLADGGMTDNFALKGLTDWFFLHTADPEFDHLLHLTRRILILVIDGQRDLDPKIAKRPEGPDASAAIDSMISNGVDQGNVASLADTAQLLERMSKLIEIRDLVVAERAWENEQSKVEAVSTRETFEGFVRESNERIKLTPKVFEDEFERYRAEVRDLETKRSATELEKRTKHLSDRWRIKEIGEWFGSITIDAENLEKALSKLYGSPEKFWEEYSKLKNNLQLMASWRRKHALVITDLVKMSIVDDCNTDRQRKLLDSPTGLGINEADINLAIEAGRDVAARHLKRIKALVESGKRELMFGCEHWLGKTAAEQGEQTARPESEPPAVR